MATKNSGMSEDTKTIIVVLFLIAFYPLGIIVMWFWVKWPMWVKILLTALIILPIMAILLAITLIAVNPARQFSQANDTKRRSDVNLILNAVYQYRIDNKCLPNRNNNNINRNIEIRG